VKIRTAQRVEGNRPRLGRLRSLVDSVFSLHDEIAAFERATEPGKRGKVVLRVVDD